MAHNYFFQMAGEKPPTSYRQNIYIYICSIQYTQYTVYYLSYWPMWQPRRLSHLKLHGFRQGRLYTTLVVSSSNSETPKITVRFVVSYPYSHHDSSLFFSIQPERNLLENSNSNPTRHGGVCSLLPCVPHLCSAWCHLSLC